MLRQIKKYILELALKTKFFKGSLFPVGSGSYGSVTSLPVGSLRGDRAVHPSVATMGPSVSMMRVLGTLPEPRMASVSHWPWGSRILLRAGTKQSGRPGLEARPGRGAGGATAGPSPASDLPRSVDQEGPGGSLWPPRMGFSGHLSRSWRVTGIIVCLTPDVFSLRSKLVPARHAYAEH